MPKPLPSPQLSIDDRERISKMPLDQKKLLAKDLYYEYAKLTVISNTLDIKLPTLKTWVYGVNSKKSKGWKVERELAKNQLLKDLSSDKRGMVYNMVDSSLFLLHHFMEKKKIDVIKTDKEITIRDAEKITNILQNLHKIVENDKDNTDDDPNFKKPANPQELMERLIDANPFSKPIEVKSKKVKAKEIENEDEDIIIDADL